MQRALVTGGAGFIGSHLVDRLIAKYDVFIIDNLSTGNRSNIPKNVTVHVEDIRNQNKITSIVKKIHPHIVLHIAGQASNIKSFNDPHFDIDVNFKGTINIVLASLEAKVRRFLYASSMTVYGIPEKIPVSEKHACRPVSYYGISKYAAERFVMATATRSDLTAPFLATSLRMFNVYGPRQDLDNPYQGPVAIFTGHVLRNEPITIYGDGKQTRDFIYIDDVVSAWLATLDNEKTYQNSYNVGSGERITIEDVAHAVVKVAGKDPNKYPIVHKPTLPGEQRHMEAHIQKISRAIGFRVATSFADGLIKTMHWAKSTL